MGRPPMPLRQRLNLLTAAVFVVFLMLAAVVGTAVALLQSALSTATEVIEPAARAVSGLSAALIDQETGQRGYLLTGRAVFLGPYQQGQQREQAAAARLATLLHDRPRLLGELAKVTQASALWREQAAEPEIAATRRGDASRQAQLTGIELGRQLFNRVRAAVEALQSDVRTLRTDGDARLHTAQERLEVALAMSVGLAAVLLIFSRVFFLRWIDEPVRALSGAIRQVRTGGPAIAAAPDSPPELVALGADIETMRASLAHEVDQAALANEALRQQGPAVLALREQLRPATLAIPTLSVVGRLEPAEGVLAGDWYDVLDLGDGRWAVVLVDVSGHGAPAGILALTLKALCTPALRAHDDLGAALGWVAANLDGWDESFATAVIVAGDERGDIVRYANAGHPPALHVHADGSTEPLAPTGPILAPITARIGWSQREVPLVPNTRLVLYTDGIVEARGNGNALYGAERLAQLLTTPGVAMLDPAAVITEALRDVAAFSPSRARDDQTMIVLERRPPGTEGVPRQSRPTHAQPLPSAYEHGAGAG